MPEVQKGPSKLISIQVPDEVLAGDLERFRQKALEFGASMAEVIPVSWIDIDERVRLKCSIPLCPYYNNCLHCPPHSPSLDLMRKTIDRYAKAVLFAIDIIPADEFSDRSKEREAVAKWAKKCFEITSKLEAFAFGSGYHLAMGLGQGSCIKALCGQERCLVLGGGKCPYPLKSRPSMESVGIDVYRLVRKVGWEIYPIYRTVDPMQVPKALAVGIVFVH
jgi:predicted metal-binding protein